jgi:hypothetical protein
MNLSRVSRRSAAAAAVLAAVAVLNTTPASALSKVTCDGYAVEIYTGSGPVCYADPGFIALNIPVVTALHADYWGGHFWYNYNADNFYFSAGDVVNIGAYQGSALRIY